MEETGRSYVALYNAIRRILVLLGSSATNLSIVRDGEGALFLYHRERRVGFCEVFHEFLGEDREGLLIGHILWQEFESMLRELKITGFERGFLDDYMPKLIGNPEIDVDRKFKAVVAVLYGGARRRSDVECLMKLDWKDLIAAIRIAQDEGIGAAEVVDFIKQPVAA